jgi:hypothetical protein
MPANLAAVVVMVLLTGTGWPQVPAAKGSISGVVVTTDRPPVPIRGVTVSTQSGRRIAVTDDLGRFSFDGLEPAQYYITAEKPPFLATTFGATRPGGDGTAVRLAAGQRVVDITIALTRGGVITGTVRDLDGAPAPNLSVTAGFTTVRTDDRGIYRVFGLAPGEYVVSAMPRDRFTMGGSISTPTTADLDAELAELRLGRLAPAPGSRPPTSYSNPRKYASVFYPGTTTPSAAVPIVVAAGEERAGIDITLVMSGSFVIAGRLIDEQSQPVPPGVMVMAFRGDRLSAGATPTVANGAFRLPNMAPDRYILRVAFSNPPANPAERPTVRWWARQVVDLADRDMDVVLQLKPPMTIAGRIVFDGAASGSMPAMTSLQLNLVARVTANEAAPPPRPTTTISPDGTFTIANVFPTAYQWSGTVSGGNAADWWLRSVVIGGKDVLDSETELEQNITGAVVTLSNRHTTLRGTMLGVAGAPTTSYHIVVYPADQTLWHATSRRIVTTRPATDGTFSFRDLPPGEYRLAALSDLDPATWRTSTSLESLAAASLNVTIGEDADVVQDVRVAR